MSSQPTWRQTSAVYHDRADEYDQWFEGSLLFDIELAAINGLATKTSQPQLEIGVGPGRFAERLEIAFGVDPALAPLKLAKKRGVHACQAVGENLPLGDQSVATVYLLFTLCFLNDPCQVFAEINRCLQDKGHLILGMVPDSGPWGQELNLKKEKNHPFYRYARFYEIDEVQKWLAKAGLRTVEIRSSLYQPPDKVKTVELSRQGVEKGAGFVVLAAQKE